MEVWVIYILCHELCILSWLFEKCIHFTDWLFWILFMGYTLADSLIPRQIQEYFKGWHWHFIDLKLLYSLSVRNCVDFNGFWPFVLMDYPMVVSLVSQNLYEVYSFMIFFHFCSINFYFCPRSKEVCLRDGNYLTNLKFRFDWSSK